MANIINIMILRVPDIVRNLYYLLRDLIPNIFQLFIPKGLKNWVWDRPKRQTPCFITWCKSGKWVYRITWWKQSASFTILVWIWRIIQKRSKLRAVIIQCLYEPFNWQLSARLYYPAIFNLTLIIIIIIKQIRSTTTSAIINPKQQIIITVLIKDFIFR
jgi:hypothetical protein